MLLVTSQKRMHSCDNQVFKTFLHMHANKPNFQNKHSQKLYKHGQLNTQKQQNMTRSEQWFADSHSENKQIMIQLALLLNAQIKESVSVLNQCYCKLNKKS